MSKSNFWTAHGSSLAEAYAHSVGTVRFEVVTRSLLESLPPGPRRVIDVGGGFGRQAILLARAGHSVVIVDLDPNMLRMAREQLSSESHEVRSRVELVLGDGEVASSLVGTGFDLACCHSVLMYEEDPSPLLSALVDLVRPGGLISILCVNKDAIAMRSGLQGRWREAVASLEAGTQMGGPYVPTRDYTREEVTGVLEAAGATVKAWHGVGVFTDHLTEAIVVDDPEEVYLAEWLAGNRDPYRQVARCFHLLAERV